MQLPADNRTLSPCTGYTRAHWETAADSLLAAVEPYATEDRALYHLPGTHTSWSGRLSDGLEGYARTLLLAAFRRDETALERYADGLAAGVAGVWPSIEDRGQPLVEAASIALALRLTRPLLWDRLDEPVRQRAAAWLADALTAEPWPCNWELFPVTVGGFLQDIGYEPDASRKAVDRGLSRIEDWYVGDGWYTDGDGRKFDYYNGWAMHLYPVLHAWLADDPRLLDLYGGRLERHLADYARLFGGDGAPMHQGRSLTYRFATTAPLWLGALTGRTPLSPGETRRLASGALQYFLERGAVDDRGLLSLGWHGPNEAVLQGYSGPASPYWASKGFLGLLLPPDHKVWTAAEEPGPAERADAVTAVAPANWLLQSTSSDGLVRLHNHGSEDVRYDPYYTRLAYSTVTAPSPSYDNSVILGGDPSRTEIVPLGVGRGGSPPGTRRPPGRGWSAWWWPRGRWRCGPIWWWAWVRGRRSGSRGGRRGMGWKPNSPPCTGCWTVWVSSVTGPPCSSRWPGSPGSRTPVPSRNWCPWRSTGITVSPFSGPAAGGRASGSRSQPGDPETRRGR